ncbi:MAG: hypothetical protein V5A88_03495, partial [Candidatus Thermoplasmatota archaeon]
CSVDDEEIMDGSNQVSIHVAEEGTSEYGILLTVIVFTAIGVLVLFVLIKKGKPQKRKDTEDLPVLQKRESDKQSETDEK